MKITIKRDFRSLTAQVYIYWENNGNIEVLLPDMKTVQTLDKHVAQEPTFSIPNGDEFIVAMQKALEDYGYKGNGESKNEGKLESTKYHLEDLRQLLKLK